MMHSRPVPQSQEEARQTKKSTGLMALIFGVAVGILTYLLLILLIGGASVPSWFPGMALVLSFMFGSVGGIALWGLMTARAAMALIKDHIDRHEGLQGYESR